MRQKVRNHMIVGTLTAVLFALLTGCSSSKDLSNGNLLYKVDVVSHSEEVDPDVFKPYLRQQLKSRWIVLKKPEPFDTLLARKTCDDFRTSLQNMGYLRAEVNVDTVSKGKKLKATYHLYPGNLYFLHSMQYDVSDDAIAYLLDNREEENIQLKEGSVFSVNELDAERKRITQLLTDSGYYRFHKDYIRYTVDTVRGSRLVDVTLHLMPYVEHSEQKPHPVYRMRNVTFSSGDDSTVHLRKSVLKENTFIEENTPYSSSGLQKTYNHFGRLSAVRYTNINFKEVPDSNLLDCDIQVSTNKLNSISFQPEGTNTAGDFGAAATLTYENRNLFRGSELFSVQLRGAFESISKLEGYQSHKYEEFGAEAKLVFPRFIAPFISNSYKRKSTATSELSISYNTQNRPEFHRRLFSGAWRYRWSDSNRHTNYRVDLLDLNYIYMPWISPTFKWNYLDSINTRNAILRYNYEDLFILKVGVSIVYKNVNNAFRVNLETAGNLLNSFSNLIHGQTNSEGQHTLFNIAYAQYAKGDLDYTHIHRIDANHSLALHAGLGIAYPYGNSNILPFEKRYFSGGANSVRGWGVRRLGPGKFKGTGNAIDFINRTGDLKIDLNAEWRMFLFWKFNGAVFVDAGNIWTLRNYPDQAGGQFKLDEFYKQLAVAYGIGLRLNFDYFILRIDMGMKAVNPAYDTKEEHWAIIHPKLSRDFAFHFAVGLPF